MHACICIDTYVQKKIRVQILLRTNDSRLGHALHCERYPKRKREREREREKGGGEERDREREREGARARERERERER